MELLNCCLLNYIHTIGNDKYIHSTAGHALVAPHPRQVLPDLRLGEQDPVRAVVREKDPVQAGLVQHCSAQCRSVDGRAKCARVL